ncbi:MAG: transporter [Limisphaerales bacterium]
MKKQIVRCLLTIALAALPGVVQAQPDAHYVPGIEGIDCATLPPPGWYFRDYNVFYLGELYDNATGHNVAPAGFQAMVYATVPRAIYISDFKVLGGYLGGDVVLPFVYSSLRNGPGGYSGSTFGVGDFYGESTLSWHPGQFDIGFATGFWAPTGNSGSVNQPTQSQPGNGYWTPELTLGVTWHPDEAKTWSISELNRFEFCNSEWNHTDITPGDAWTAEWGISKKVLKTVDCGIVGYYQQRVTASTGSGPLGNGDSPAYFPYSRVAAVGPEVNVFIPCWKLWTSLRYNYEFMAADRVQGHTVALVLTKAF